MQKRNQSQSIINELEEALKWAKDTSLLLSKFTHNFSPTLFKNTEVSYGRAFSIVEDVQSKLKNIVDNFVMLEDGDFYNNKIRGHGND